MVKIGWTVLKIGIHSAFGPNLPNWSLALWTLKIWSGLVDSVRYVAMGA